MDDFVYEGQVAYYHDTTNQLEIIVKLKYPDYQVWVNRVKVYHILHDVFEGKKVVKIPCDFRGHSEYYIVWSDDDDEVFVMRKCDGIKYFKRTLVVEEGVNEIRQIAKTEVIEEAI